MYHNAIVEFHFGLKTYLSVMALHRMERQLQQLLTSKVENHTNSWLSQTGTFYVYGSAMNPSEIKSFLKDAYSEQNYKVNVQSA